MRIDDAIKILEYPVFKWSLEWDDREDGLDYCDAIQLAITALKEKNMIGNICSECSGFMYRKTKSGEFVPCNNICSCIHPACYVPDGDGCKYLIYSDYDDEPIDKCKECQFCLSGKVRKTQDYI